MLMLLLLLHDPLFLNPLDEALPERTSVEKKLGNFSPVEISRLGEDAPPGTTVAS